VDYFICIVLTGVGATVLMDVWSVVRERTFRIAPPNYGLVGRWVAHMIRGRFRHESIANSAPMHRERLIGWTAHYVIGVAFAAILLGVWGLEWVQQPAIGPALIVGVGSVMGPFLIMQPGMGAGVAASRTPCPNTARMQSVATHGVFALGLYAGGWLARLYYVP